MSAFVNRWAIALLLVGVGIGLGWGLNGVRQPLGAQDAKPKSPAGQPEHDRMMADSQAAYAPDWQRQYPQSQPLLKPFPACKPGEIMPQDLYRYGGKGQTSFASVDDIKDFDEF